LYETTGERGKAGLRVRKKFRLSGGRLHRETPGTFHKKNIPVDSENIDFLYSRRHLATVRDGKWRELKYVTEFDELERVIWKTLDRIRKRDGIKIFKEATDRIVESVARV
jgi:hypothetical protein